MERFRLTLIESLILGAAIALVIWQLLGLVLDVEPEPATVEVGSEPVVVELELVKPIEEPEPIEPIEPIEEPEPVVERDASYFLKLMDDDLDAIERGEEARGSYTDFFMRNAAFALKAGASMEDIDPRLDRLIALASNGVFLSSYMVRLMYEGGPWAVRRDAMSRLRKSGALSSAR